MYCAMRSCPAYVFESPHSHFQPCSEWLFSSKTRGTTVLFFLSSCQPLRAGESNVGLAIRVELITIRWKSWSSQWVHIDQIRGGKNWTCQDSLSKEEREIKVWKCATDTKHIAFFVYAKSMPIRQRWRNTHTRHSSHHNLMTLKSIRPTQAELI